MKLQLLEITMIIKFSLVITILVRLILCDASGESYPKSSLAFVIDKTRSMKTVIKAVKSQVNAIFDAVESAVDSPIDNYVLVTFGDPNVSNATITTDRSDFKEAITSITLEDGGDCPEFSMSGIKKGLEESLPGSYIYVFTDASAKDYYKLEQVKNIAQQKDCQVVFVITDNARCNESISTEDDVYQKLATSTSGQVFNLHKHETKKILKYVEDSIISRRVYLVNSRKYPPGDHTLYYEPDVRTTDTTIALSGSYCEATALGPCNETLDEYVLIKLPKILIFKVEETTPGVYSLKFTSKSSSHVVISAWSDVKFRHGFSKVAPSSINDTVVRPHPDVKNYLLIKLYGEGVQLTTVKFLDPNYHKITEIPLKILDEEQKTYITDMFYPPTTTMRVAVKGIDVASNTTIVRFGTMLLERERFLNKNPTISIEGDDKVIVDYNDPVQLQCAVNAYPKPTITWKHIASGTILPSTMSVRLAPYDYFSILELESANENATYECYAANNMGIDYRSVRVEVKQKPYFNILEKPRNMEVDYNTEAVLHCRVDAFPPAKITWHLAGPRRKRGFSLRAKIRVSADGSTLTIKHVQPSVVGVYVCKAENDNKKIYSRAFISTNAKTPKIDKSASDIKVREGDSASLTCSLLEGKPKPEILWFRKYALHPSGKYTEIEEGRNQTTISLMNVNRYDTGIYKCRANNVIGIDVHTIDFSVECLPSIADDVKSIVAKTGDEIKMSCLVEGIPTPEVVWLKDAAPMGSEIVVYRDHSCKIEAVDLHHTGIYTCTATNNLGSTKRTVQVTVYSLQIIYPLKTRHSIKRNSKLSIKCPIDGVPEPVIRWIFFSFDKTVPPKYLPTLKDRLAFKRIREKERGNYTCVATNVGGSLNVTHDVDVLFPPEIQADLKPEYRAVDGDRMLKIHCKATGNPKPVITWWKNGAALAIGDRYLYSSYYTEDDWLIIKYVNRSDTSGSYYCEARNSIKSLIKTDTGTFDIIIEKSPPADSIINTTTIFIEEGAKVPIKCYISHEKADALVWYKDGSLFHKGELELHKAQGSDSGLYTCRVNHLKLSTVESANTKVIVRSKPMFVTEEKTEIELEFGQSGFFNCKVLGEPEPTVTWWHNGATMRFSEMVYNFKMDTETAGTYFCRVTNAFGSISRTFELKLKGCVLNIDSDSKYQPLILTTSETLPDLKVFEGRVLLAKGQNVAFSCPKHFKGFERAIIIAQCYMGTKFIIDGALHDYTDVKCNQEVKSYVSKTREQCLGKGTKTVQVVLDTNHKTIEAYNVCLDGDDHPKYAKHIMRSPAGYTPRDTSMSDGSNLDDLYRCRNQKHAFSRRNVRVKSDCCFARRHLVNPRDVFPGPSQRATFNLFNMVPIWSSCHAENWDEVESRVRKLANSIKDDLVVYTGTYGYLHLRNTYGRMIPLFLGQKTRQPISKYMWKVIQYPAAGSSLAIVQLNIPEVSLSEVGKHVFCRDICQDVPWMKGPYWRDLERGYTFCCNLKDFEIVTGYNDVFEPGLSEVLNVS